LLPMAEALELSVAAWSPLTGGILSGKFSRTESGESGSRIERSAISEKDLAAARVVDAVADELGISSSQVALAWTMAKSPIIHPIVGARRLAQLTENMAALTVSLPADVVSRLNEARAFEVGFSTDFANDVSGWVFGDANQRLIPRRAGPF
jgi:aryl-alcohol dehydrogenase-like predicted oxidoreductase